MKKLCKYTLYYWGHLGWSDRVEREYRLIIDRFRVFPVTPSYVSWWVHTTLRFGGGSEVTGIRELPGKHDSKIWL